MPKKSRPVEKSTQRNVYLKPKVNEYVNGFLDETGISFSGFITMLILEHQERRGKATK
jgi:hypothetical protein